MLAREVKPAHGGHDVSGDRRELSGREGAVRAAGPLLVVPAHRGRAGQMPACSGEDLLYLIEGDSHAVGFRHRSETPRLRSGHVGEEDARLSGLAGSDVPDFGDRQIGEREPREAVVQPEPVPED